MTSIWSLWQQLSVYIYLHFTASETIPGNSDISFLPMQRIIYTEAPQMKAAAVKRAWSTIQRYRTIQGIRMEGDTLVHFPCLQMGGIETKTVAKKRVIRETLWIFSETIFQLSNYSTLRGLGKQSRYYYEKLSTQITELRRRKRLWTLAKSRTTNVWKSRAKVTSLKRKEHCSLYEEAFLWQLNKWHTNNPGMHCMTPSCHDHS